MKQQQYLAQIQQIFKSFDLDHSGTIEIGELKKVAQALGENLSGLELREIVKKLDINKDGKISFEEFKFWWVYGQKGKLSQLVYLRAKSMKLANGFFKTIQQAGVDLTKFNKNSLKADKFQVDLSLGAPIKEGINIEVSVCHKGQKFVQHFSYLKSIVPTINQEAINFCILLSTQNPQKLVQQLKKILQKLIGILPIPIQSLQDNSFACIKIVPLKSCVVIHAQLKQNLNAIFNDPFAKFDQIDQLLEKQFCLFGQASISTNFSIKQLIQETNMLEILLKGLSLKLKTEVPSSITKKFREVLEADRQAANNFGFLLLVLLKSLKLKIKLNTPQKMHNFFKKLGISQLVAECPSFKNLIQLASLLINAEQSKTNVESPMGFLYQFLKILKNFLNQKVEVVIHRKQTLLKLQMSMPGGSKLFQMIYNQL